MIFVFKIVYKYIFYCLQPTYFCSMGCFLLLFIYFCKTSFSKLVDVGLVGGRLLYGCKSLEQFFPLIYPFQITCPLVFNFNLFIYFTLYGNNLTKGTTLFRSISPLCAFALLRGNNTITSFFTTK
ncbi:hypothetical protein M2137_002950 [Parabacteroides sp. PFB2-10]|nr:hypothetical protein [Parabacteroides sp. PFB2-10]